MFFVDGFFGMDVSLLLALAAVFVVAGLIKGVVGLGLPTVSMALLALWMSPAQAAAMLIIPSLVTNIWQTRPWGGLRPLLGKIGPLQAGICLGTWTGALVFGAPAGAWATASLGAVLMAYALWGLFGTAPRARPEKEAGLGVVLGALTGLLTSLTGVFVVPAVPYLQALGLSRDELIQAMGISFTVSTLALAVGLWFNGSYSAGAVGFSLLMLLPALAGMGIGQRLRRRLSPRVFRLCFFTGLLLLGLHLVSGALIG